MTTDWMRTQIDQLLAQASEAISRTDWKAARDHAESILGLDPGNADGQGIMAAAERVLGIGKDSPAEERESTAPLESPQASFTQPVTFSDGRYQVRQFLGERGKKRIDLAHDGTLTIVADTNTPIS